jgi:hypothetical protein
VTRARHAPPFDQPAGPREQPDIRPLRVLDQHVISRLPDAREDAIDRFRVGEADDPAHRRVVPRPEQASRLSREVDVATGQENMRAVRSAFDDVRHHLPCQALRGERKEHTRPVVERRSDAPEELSVDRDAFGDDCGVGLALGAQIPDEELHHKSAGSVGQSGRDIRNRVLDLEPSLDRGCRRSRTGCPRTRTERSERERTRSHPGRAGGRPPDRSSVSARSWHP